MLTIEMLPASQGDCLWIEYGEPGRLRRVLIDGGLAGTYKTALRRKLAALPEKERRLELLIVTHVDLDHIGGALELIRDRALKVQYGDIWFNGFKHLTKPDELGPAQGEYLSDEIVAQGLPWNALFSGKAVVVPEGPLPECELPGGLKLTLLSPTPEKLGRLRPVWEKEVKKAGLVPGGKGEAEGEEAEKAMPADALGEDVDLEVLASRKFKADPGEANGSSIAVLLEHEGKRCLLTGDAHEDALMASMARLVTKGKRLRVHAIKLPHHGSRNNISQGLSNLLECNHYLISTNGSVYGHPDREAIARVILGGDSRVLHFNYRSEVNEFWDDKKLMRRYGYEVRYPEGGGTGLVVAV